MEGMRLVVGCVNERGAVGLEPVAKGKGRVIQVLGRDADAAELERTLGQVVEAEVRTHRLHRDRRVLVGHLPLEGLLQRAPTSTGCIDLPITARREEGGKEGKTLNVIPVGVADQERAAQATAAARHELGSEPVSARTTVENQQRAIRGAHLHAGGVPPVAQRRSPRLRDGSPGAPEANAHGVSLHPSSGARNRIIPAAERAVSGCRQTSAWPRVAWPD